MWFCSFFIIAFASYVDSEPDFNESFSDWLKVGTCIHRAGNEH